MRKKIILILCVFLKLTDASDVEWGVTTSSTEEPTGAHELTDGERVTSAYSNSLTLLLDLMNGTVDACENFFEHACGNYAAHQQRYAHTPPPYLSNLEDRMHFFLEHRMDFATVAGRSLQQLYDKCKERSGDARAQWRRILREVDFLAPQELLYRHFPMLHHQWSSWVRGGGRNSGRYNGGGEERQTSWVPLAANFAAHGIPTILNVFFAENTIYIAAPTDAVDVTGRSKESWRCPSWEAITASLQPLLRGRNGQVALIISRELYELCMELSDGWRSTRPPKHSNGDDDEATAEETLEQEEAAFLLSDDIVHYFEVFFIALNFTADDINAARKLPLNVPQLQHILRVVRHTQPRLLYNYVLWRAYEQMRYDDCFQLTEEFEPALVAEYWHWAIFQPQMSRDVMLSVFLFHTARYYKKRRRQLHFIRSWTSVLWQERSSETDYQRRQHMRRIRELESLIREYANKHLSVEAAALSYNDSALDSRWPQNFYGHMLRLRRERLQHSFHTPYIDVEDADEPAYVLRQFLHFAIAFIKRPLFHYFATIQFDMWHSASKLFYTTDDFYAAWDCLANTRDLQSSSMSLEEAEALAIYDFARAFRGVYIDYTFWLEAQTFAFAEDFFLQYFGMDRQRVLFYAVAQIYCGRNDALYAGRVNRSFREMLEFNVAFNCSSDAGSCL